MRFDGPLQVTPFRWTAEPVDIGGVTIPAGEIVLVGMLTANRDPACSAQPAALDITRTVNPHLAFGHGIHHCLGMTLARLEGSIALAPCWPVSLDCGLRCPRSSSPGARACS